ncbi:hypothetical protein PHLCEN_2v11198 [Hermanssonia centrifuga]|uniref:Selenoprotein O n=1 Tax=Hermanssonia centrifuga TaxID=98765 RepID=A0A2R6NKX8_9APHY|nr:hypothetical protein PHLCEN_2v11198 [Hermanssonia centrifuga]
MSFVTKVPLSALPLPPHSLVLTKILIPDPHTPSPSEFRKLQLEKPSQQRRARILAPESHFSYVAPFPVPFPFRIEPKEGEEVIDKAALIERWLTEREAVHERSESTIHLKKYYPENRDQHLELVGLSETGLQDCVPHLHVGDAFDVLGSPTLSRSFEDEPDRPESRNEDVAARQELIEILSGHATLMNITEDPEKSWAPWSLRYSGHQFGVWAGQLGDGRAISVREWAIATLSSYWIG